MNRQRTIGKILETTAVCLLALTTTIPVSAQDGGLDLSFSNDGIQRVTIDIGGTFRDVALATTIQTDGKIILAGQAAVSATDVDGAVVRLLPTGELDASFDTDGKLVVNIGDFEDSLTEVIVQPDGKILLGGVMHFGTSDYDFVVVRLNSDGSRDTSFGINGLTSVAFDFGGDNNDTLEGMALQTDGKIVLVGGVHSASDDFDIGIARLQTNGVLDSTFSDDGKTTLFYDAGGFNNDIGKAVAIQTDGKIVIAATYEKMAAETDIGVFRLTASGVTDSTFAGGGAQIAFDLTGPNTGVDVASALTIDTMGRIVVVGHAESEHGDFDMAFMRLNTDGSMDSTFSDDGKRTYWLDQGFDDFDSAEDVATLPDGRIVAVGMAMTDPNDMDVAVVRLKADGDPDLTFGNGGEVLLPLDYGGNYSDAGFGVAIQNDGKIVLGGKVDAGPAGGQDADFFAARLISSQADGVFADGFESGGFGQWSLVIQ